MKTMTRLCGFPLFLASSYVPGLPQIRHISRLLGKQHRYCDKGISQLNYSSSKLRARTAFLLYNYEQFCRVIPSVFHSSNNSIKNDSIFVKCYHTTCSNSFDHEDDCGGTRSVESLIETWFYEVCPHGSLEVNLPFRTEIRPLHPEDYPDMNKVIIQLHFAAPRDTEVPNAHQLSQISDLYSLNVGFDEDKANMKISCDVVKGVIIPLSCTLLVPLKFDLKLNLHGDNTVSVQKMESNMIAIESEKGNCYLNNIKSGSISALCRSGNITCKSALLGNVHFHTGKSGSIVADKLQGSNIMCETELGSVVVKSLYADNAMFRSDAGNVHLGQCHGQVCMQAEKSHLKIESLDGDLDVGLQSGSVDVHLSRHSRAFIDVTTGDISISFPEGTSTDLSLDSRTVIVDKNIDARFVSTGLPHHKEGHIGEKGKALVNARTLSGAIHLKYLDWIHTTKLVFKSDEEDV